MRKIVVDMQNFLFADSVATAFRNSDYEIDVVRTESPTAQLKCVSSTNRLLLSWR